MLHIGTDEAGYGPLLGPLVIAAAAYRTDAPRRKLPGEGIDDSKVVYGQGGRAALARVLGPYLGLETPLRLSDLLARRSVRGDPRTGYAWYGEVEDPEAAPGAAPAAFSGLFLNPVCERAFNDGVARHGGKGGVLFEETMRVVHRVLDAFPGEDAEIVCDKHGGRNRYAGLLMASLMPSTLVTECESAACSAYRLQQAGRSIRIRFLKEADGADVPAALASMAAKYVRELFMQGLNEYFAAKVDGLKPTAGYYGDGRRFLREIDGVLSCAREDLVRVC